MNNTLVKLFGWKGAVLNGDPLVFDRWKWLSKKLKTGPVKTLDAGCGSGCFSLYAASQGNRVTGVDFGGPNVHTARTRAKILELNQIEFREHNLKKLGELASEIGLFDQVLSFEVIEHIQDDNHLMADMSSLLKPGGQLILTTPFRDYKRMWGDKLSEQEDGGHVRWGYTHAEMRALMEKNGLEVVTEEYISGMVSQKLCNVMRRSNQLHSHFGWGVTFPFRVFQAIDDPMTKFAGYPYFSIGVVARKK